MVTRKNGHHGLHLRATRGNTQGGLALLTLFNVVAERLVRHCISITLEDETVIRNGLVNALVWSLGVLYVNDGILGLWYP